jgi:hypothetical protein
MTRGHLRQFTFWVMLADFPILYLGAITFENSLLIFISLGVMAFTTILALFSHR